MIEKGTGMSRASRNISRRELIKASAGAAALSALPLSRPATSLAQATPSPAAQAGEIISSVKGVPPAYEKYPNPQKKTVSKTPGTGNKVTMLTLSYTPPVQPHDKNQYWQELEKRLGVKYDANLIPFASYGEKVAAILAGGDLPDLFYVLLTSSAATLYGAIDQGAFADLTDILGSDKIKDYPNLAAMPSYLWDNVKYNGKIYGVPKPVLVNNDPTFYRKDWADKLGFSELKTTDDVYNMLVAFRTKDPDGNGKEDTWGVGMYGGWGLFIFEQIFRVPWGWKLNDDGTLVNAVETDEFKQTLDFANRLYKGGAFHPDSASLTVQQANDLLTGGKTGIYTGGFAAFYGSSGLVEKTASINPKADLAPLLPPGANGQPSVTYQGPGYFGFTAIPAKTAQDKGKLEELLQILNYLMAPFGSEESTFLMYGIPGVDSKQTPDGGFELTDKGTSERGALVYPFLSEDYFFYPGEPGIATKAQKFNEQMAQVGITNPVQGLFSKTNGQKAAQLAQLLSDAETAIVTGRKPLDSWDDTVKQWKQRGGDQIRTEYEDGLKKSNG